MPIFQPKENTNKSCSCNLLMKYEEDNEMIVPRSFSYRCACRIFSKALEMVFRNDPTSGSQ
ncbi:hypothetical protein TorRG33x02_108180 [Trema orientale]|uniref:Uncharacterized protein n=1 Tax=Trema orientale TaxID=63057 RepID=A0A2P5F6X0_TREOI|nr:hypothetical protein TorRG33x02_108180 [Trema orientale]